MKVLDLFSGIGGFSLGLERAGFTTVAFCEIDPYCQKVLRKHWPAVPIYNDITTLTADRLAAGIDVICGGFPCQDISYAGTGAGIAGERSGLWKEYARLIGEIRPRYAIVENVAALLYRGLDRVLGDLAALGYDAEWHCIPAAAIGAPHRRDRVWIVAYPNRDSESDQSVNGQVAGKLGDSEQPRLAFTSAFAGILGSSSSGQSGHSAERSGWWDVEPQLGRVAHGIPHRVDRLRGLGNAVVPQIVEMIGRAICQRR